MKIYRKILNITTQEIEKYSNLKNKSSIYYLEKTYQINKLFRYILLLRKKGVDVNKFLDEELQKEEQ